MLQDQPSVITQGERETFLTKVWLPYALQDSTVFVATMAYAVAYLEKLGVNYHGSVLLSYKGEAIRAINANLGDSEKAISDATMGAVAQLASIEVGNSLRLPGHPSPRFRLTDIGRLWRSGTIAHPHESSPQDDRLARWPTEHCL